MDKVLNEVAHSKDPLLKTPTKGVLVHDTFDKKIKMSLEDIKIEKSAQDA